MLKLVRDCYLKYSLELSEVYKIHLIFYFLLIYTVSENASSDVNDNI